MTTHKVPGNFAVGERPGLSEETLNLLATLLSRVTLSPVADDFEEQARIIGTARRELLAALARFA